MGILCTRCVSDEASANWLLIERFDLWGALGLMATGVAPVVDGYPLSTTQYLRIASAADSRRDLQATGRPLLDTWAVLAT